VSSLELPPDHYIRACTRLAIQGSGLSPLLSRPEPEEPSNVYSIEAARTRRCIEILCTRGKRDEV
jgi:hypothetical protein